MKVIITTRLAETVSKMRADCGGASLVYNMGYRGTTSFRSRTRAGMPTQIVLNPGLYPPDRPVSAFSEARLVGIVHAENAGYRLLRLNNFSVLRDYHIELAQLGQYLDESKRKVMDETLFYISSSMIFLRLMVAYNIMENRYGFHIPVNYSHINDPISFAQSIKEDRNALLTEEQYTLLKQSPPLIRQAISPVLSYLAEKYVGQTEDVRRVIRENLDPTLRSALDDFLKAAKLDGLSSDDLHGPNFLTRHFTPEVFDEAQEGVLNYLGKGTLWNFDTSTPEEDDKVLLALSQAKLEQLKAGGNLNDALSCLDAIQRIETLNADEQTRVAFDLCLRLARTKWTKFRDSWITRRLMTMCARIGYESAGMYLYDLVRQEIDLKPVLRAREIIAKYKPPCNLGIGLLFSALETLASVNGIDVKADIEEGIKYAIVLVCKITERDDGMFVSLDSLAVTARMMGYHRASQLFVEKLMEGDKSRSI